MKTRYKVVTKQAVRPSGAIPGIPGRKEVLVSIN